MRMKTEQHTMIVLLSVYDNTTASRRKRSANGPSAPFIHHSLIIISSIDPMAWRSCASSHSYTTSNMCWWWWREWIFPHHINTRATKGGQSLFGGGGMEWSSVHRQLHIIAASDRFAMIERGNEIGIIGLHSNARILK